MRSVFFVTVTTMEEDLICPFHFFCFDLFFPLSQRNIIMLFEEKFERI